MPHSQGSHIVSAESRFLVQSRFFGLGDLFKGISLHVASRTFSDTFSAARQRALFAMFAGTSLKQMNIRLQSFSSKPDGK